MTDSISISPEQFRQDLNTGKVGFMFDLRNKDEFKSWKIEGPKTVETLNIPQPDFIGEEESYMDMFPKDKRIITICAHGDSSRYTAKLLQERGYNAQSLEGGMDAWSGYYQITKISEDPVIYQVNRVARGCLGYIITTDGEALVIDAARHLEPITSLLKKNGLILKHVFDTHIHADHISGGRILAELNGAKYYLSEADADGAAFQVVSIQGGKHGDYENSYLISLGKNSIQVIESPGHTPGSISLLLNDKILFTGDIVMKSAIGRPDLGGKADSWSLMLHKTLFERYADLQDSVLVLPSHAVPLFDEDEVGVISTTLGIARKTLDLFQLSGTEDFKKQVKASLPTNPERYQDIRKVNLGLLEPEEDRLKELEIGKNLCGMDKAS